MSDRSIHHSCDCHASSMKAKHHWGDRREADGDRAVFARPWASVHAAEPTIPPLLLSKFVARCRSGARLKHPPKAPGRQACTPHAGSPAEPQRCGCARAPSPASLASRLLYIRWTSGACRRVFPRAIRRQEQGKEERNGKQAGDNCRVRMGKDTEFFRFRIKYVYGDHMAHATDEVDRCGRERAHTLFVA